MGSPVTVKSTCRPCGAQGDHECICKLVCGVCKVCAYAYTCTCVDYALHNTACKHIHFIHMVTLRTVDQSADNRIGQELETTSSTSTPASQVSDESLKHILQKAPSTLDIQWQLVVSKAHEVLVLAKSIDSAEGLQAASQHLTSAISIMKAPESQMPQQVLPCQKRPAPNARLEPQVRYHSTKKKREKLKSLSKPSTAQTIQAKEMLESGDVRLCSVCLKEDDEEQTEEVEWHKVQCLTPHPSLYILNNILMILLNISFVREFDLEWQSIV